MSKFNDRETKADELERATPFSKFVQSPYSSWFLFSISLFFTLIAYSITSKSNQRHMQDLFKFEVAQTLQAIEQRMQGYQQVLRGGIGLFKASEHVNRQEFHDYVTNLAVNKHWPGIQGIGYAVMLKPEEKEVFVNTVKLEGFNEFKVFPAGERDKYSSILYLEPLPLETSALLAMICIQKKLAISRWISLVITVMSHFLPRLSWFRRMAMIYKMAFSCTCPCIEVEHPLKA